MWYLKIFIIAKNNLIFCNESEIMKTNYFAQLTRKLALITGIVGMGAFVSVPAIAEGNYNQTPANSTESSTGAAYGQENMMTNPNAGTTEANLVELASSNDSFNTLVQAVQAAGLADTLANQGPYTIFAPTDEAFAALPEGTLEFLLRPENKQLLQQVLTYHVVSGEVTSSELTTGPVDTLGGGVAVRVAEDRVIVNNGSVIQPNIPASNGVIHAVNRVLLPQEVRESLVSQLEAQAAQ